MERLMLDDTVGFRLSRVARARRQAWSQELTHLGLTPPQAAILRGIAESSDRSLRSLARTLGTDPMSAKRCVDELESRELVRSSSLPQDRRPRVLNLTDAGRQVMTELDFLVRRQEVRLRTMLSPVDYQQLLGVLDRLEEGLHLTGSPGERFDQHGSE
jgi:DNA-binding MarR family transcriptional regulator